MQTPMPSTGEEFQSIKKQVDSGKLDLEPSEEEGKLPDEPEDEKVSGDFSSDDVDDVEDEYKWDCDEDTFTFERLVFQDEVSDVCTVNPNLRVRVRTLSASERQTLYKQQAEKTGPIAGISMTNASDLLWLSGETSIEALMGMLVDINDREVIPNKGKREAWIRSRPDVLVELLTKVCNEFTRRARRLARRGDPKNC